MRPSLNMELEIINNILSTKYKTIQLSEIDSASLLVRRDYKYVMDISNTIDLLNHLTDYKILEINSKKVFNYKSTYFDTANLALYKMHHAGRLNRYKVRFREYLDDNSTFFEIKKKDNHGRTIKTRIKSDSINKNIFTNDQIAHLNAHSPLASIDLNEIIQINYQRITIVNKDKTERITIDLNLNFSHENKTEYFGKLAIIEIKQEKSRLSEAKTFLKKNKIRQGGVSKYCLGIIIFFENISHNRFLHRFNKLYKPYKFVS